MLKTYASLTPCPWRCAGQPEFVILRCVFEASVQRHWARGMQCHRCDVLPCGSARFHTVTITQDRCSATEQGPLGTAAGVEGEAMEGVQGEAGSAAMAEDGVGNVNDLGGSGGGGGTAGAPRGALLAAYNQAAQWQRFGVRRGPQATGAACHYTA